MRLTLSLVRLALALGALLAAPHALAARPASLAPRAWGEGLAWEPQPVRAPVVPGEVRGAPPFVPRGASEVPGGEVEVGPGRGAALWLAPWSVVRVEGAPDALRFTRVLGQDAPDAPGLHVEEAGVPERPGRWYLAEPAGGGSVWVVTATRATRVRVERPVARPEALADEAVREALLGWVDGQGALPALPFWAELRATLEADAELAAQLAAAPGAGPRLAEALAAWRKARALEAWARVQPLHAEAWRFSPLAAPGAPLALPDEAAPLTRLPGRAGSWELAVEGPALLVLKARPLGRRGERARLWVEEDGLTRLTRELPFRPGFLADGEDGALPSARSVRTLPDGTGVGAADELRVQLAPGKHRLRVAWEDGEVALRARLARRRPFLGEALAGVDSPHALARSALRALEGDRSPAAALLRRRLDVLAPAAEAPAPADARGLSPLLAALAGLDAAGDAQGPGARARLAREAAQALDRAEAGGALAWSLRVRAAALLVDGGEPDRAHRLLAAAPFPPSGWLAAEAADVVARLPLGAPWRSRELAALELAWRREPLARDVRQRYRDAWYAHARWAPLTPLAARAGGVLAPRRWLDVDAAGDDTAGPGAHWPLVPGAPVRVGTRAGAATPTLLRAWVLPGTAQEGPLALRVDGTAFPLLPTAAVEGVEVALPPGEHTVALEAPRGARAYVSLPPEGGQGASGGGLAYVRSAWPARAGDAPVRFRVPDAQLVGPVRLQLRADGLPPGAPLTVWLHTDVGAPRRLTLVAPAPRAASLALGAEAGPAPAPAEAVLHLPPLTREVWLTLADGAPRASLWVALAVRRPRGGESPTDALAGVLGGPDAADGADTQLLALSRQLAQGEGQAPRLARAELLAQLGEVALARADVAVLLEQQDRLGPAQAQRLLALMARLEEDAAPGRVRFAAPIQAPTLVSPGYAALGAPADAGLLALAREGREGRAKAALERLPAGDARPAARYLRARLLAAAGRPHDAALALAALYRETDAPALGLEALELLSAQEGAGAGWTTGGAPLCAALAERLSAWAELPEVRGARAAALRWTRWERLRDAEEMAGQLSAELGRGPDEQGERVRKALLAPPWPLDEVRLVRAGSGSVLEVTAEPGAERLGAEVLCRAVGRAPGEEQPACRFALRVDGRTVQEEVAPPGRAVRLAGRLDGPGRHQLEVVLDRASAPGLALVRFVALPGGSQAPVPLAARQPLALLRSRPGQPVVMTVLGPTALRVGARARAPGAGRELLIRADLLNRARPAPRAPERLALPEAPDARVTGVPGGAGAEAETLLLLPEPGPHRVRLEPSDGEVLLQVSAGVARPPAGDDTPWWAQGPTGLEPLRWPALPPALAQLPDAARATSPRTGGPGMLTLEVAGRHEAADEEDVGALALRPPRTGLEARLGWRRELWPDRAWARLEPLVRVPREGAPVLGGGLALDVLRLPLALRLHLTGNVAAGTLDGAWQLAARGRLSLDRYVPLDPDWGLIPSLALTAERVAAADDPRLDRMLWSRWAAEHPVRLSPRLALRWQPFRDQVGTLALGATSNADLASPDSAGGSLEWAALFGGAWAPRATLGYGAGWRFQDAHRTGAYLRHRASLRLDVSPWRGPLGRLLLFAEDRLLGSGRLGVENLVSVGVRWDAAFGRGLRDLAPAEEEFEELLDAKTLR